MTSPWRSKVKATWMRRRKHLSWTRYDLVAVCCALIMIWPNLAGKTAKLLLTVIVGRARFKSFCFTKTEKKLRLKRCARKLHSSDTKENSNKRETYLQSRLFTRSEINHCIEFSFELI